MKFSIVIPTYEAKGNGVLLLKNCLDSINLQTFRDFEIIISDHSQNSHIEEFVNMYTSSRSLNITHFYNNRGRGNSSINMNEGIKKAKGEFIKILHFDDIFYITTALERISNILQETNLKWGATAFNHFDGETKVFGDIRIPSADGVRHHENTGWGCPSISFFHNDREEMNLFDENMIWINDHDMHYRLKGRYNKAAIVTTPCISVRRHSNQVSQTHSGQSIEEKEWEYFYKKHNIIK